MTNIIPPAVNPPEDDKRLVRCPMCGEKIWMIKGERYVTHNECKWNIKVISLDDPFSEDK